MKKKRKKEVFQGLPQGGVFSPLLYVIYTKDLTKTKEEGIYMLQFADNIEKREQKQKEELERAINILYKELGKIGLNLELEKNTMDEI